MNEIKSIFKNKFRMGLKSLPYLIVSILVGVTAVYAGSINKLIPSGNAINDQMYSLTDIYNLATDGTPAEEKTGEIADTPERVSGEGTGVTLTQVYNAVSNAIESTGGIDFSDMFNGSSATVDGGTQADGGVDDCNYAGDNMCGTPPADRFETEWTLCTEGNDYCGTEDDGAYMKDEATGLVWSYPLKGVGGKSWDTETDPEVLTAGCGEGNCAYWSTDTYYSSWNNTNQNNDEATAQELCSAHSGWSLPHQKQLMQAYIDGAYGNIEPEGVFRNYWSATTVSPDAGYAWSVILSVGLTNDDNKDNDRSVRCVRE